MVDCVKLNKRLPGLPRPPFPNDTGNYVYENLSADGWKLWLEESIRYINTRGVDLSTAEGTKFVLEQLRIWLGMEDGEMMQTAWTPPEENSEQE